MTNNNNLHVNYYSKNNNEIPRKFISHRSSSVIANKKSGPKMNIIERKNKYKNYNINNYKSNSKAKYTALIHLTLNSIGLKSLENFPALSDAQIVSNLN